MLFYASIMLLFLLLAMTKQNRVRSTMMTVFCGTILALIMGLKSESVGNDTENYVYFFKRIGSMSSWTDLESRFETGYQIYSKIIGKIFNNYQYLFIITAIVCMVCVGVCICKYSANAAYSFFLFVGLRIFYFFLSGLRQSIAVSIVMIAFIMLQEKKYVRFVLLVLLATTFHTSAFIFLLAWPISRMRLSGKGILITGIGILGVYVLFAELLSLILGLLPSYYAHYLTTSAFDAGNLANYLDFAIKMAFLVLAYLMNYGSRERQKAISDNQRAGKNAAKTIPIQDTYIYFMIISAGLSLVATRASMLDRLEQYYWIFAVISIPDILAKIEKRKNKVIVITAVTILIVAYNLLLLWLRPEWNMIVPYKFFWEN